MDQAENLNPRTRRPKIAAELRGAPFFAFPQARLMEMIEPMATGLRSLPLAQLENEYQQLLRLTADASELEGLVAALMRGLYCFERDRRTDPELVHDDELHEALGRLERQTTEHDRRLVHDIGKGLFKAGGELAMVRAKERMLALVPEKNRRLRGAIIFKRWAGIAR